MEDLLFIISSHQIVLRKQEECSVGREWSILVVDFWFSLLAKVMTKLSNFVEFEGGH